MYNKKLVFSAACLGMLLFGIVLISLGSILPSITIKFELDEISIGTLASILPFGILAGSLVFGPIVDRYGYKNLLIICSLMVLAGLEGIAYAESLFVLQISMLLIGFGGGVINGGTNALVSDISTKDKGASLSYLGVFFGIGALGMPAILGLLSRIIFSVEYHRGNRIFCFYPGNFLHYSEVPCTKAITRISDKRRVEFNKGTDICFYSDLYFSLKAAWKG